MANSGGNSCVLEKLNFIMHVFFSFIFRSLLEANTSRLSNWSCKLLNSRGRTCLVLSLKLKGWGLSTGSSSRHLLRLKAYSMLRSSMYLRLREFGLGTASFKRAPLNMMIKRRMSRYAPWGEDPVRSFLEDVSLYNACIIDLSDLWSMIWGWAGANLVITYQPRPL